MGRKRFFRSQNVKRAADDVVTPGPPGPPAPLNILFVVANTTNLQHDDAEMQTRLTSVLGHTVTLIAHDTAEANQDDYDLAFISGSVSASTLGTKYVNWNKPVIIGDRSISDTFNIASGNFSEATDTQITITATGNALAAGKTGDVTVYTSNDSIYYETADDLVDGEYSSIAHIEGNSAQLSIVHVQAGQTGQSSFVYPADRIVTFFDSQAFTKLTSDGLDLFDAHFSFFQTASDDYADSLPLSLTEQNIGSMTVVGDTPSVEYSPSLDSFRIRSNQHNLSSTADRLIGAFRPLTGNWVMTAKVVSTNSDFQYAYGGIMIRESLDSGARFFAALQTPLASDAARVMTRKTTDAQLTYDSFASSTTPPIWFRVTRNGDSITAEYRIGDTDSWLSLGSSSTQTFTSLNSILYWGIIGTDQDNNGDEWIIDNVTFTINTDGDDLPAGVSEDTIGTAGDASVEYFLNSNSYQITASGTDGLTGTTTNGVGALRELTGDFDISVVVSGVTGSTDEFNRIGLVAINDKASSDDPYIFVGAASGNDGRANWRLTEGGSNSQNQIPGSVSSIPLEYRMTRVGSVFSTFYREVGSNTWLPLNSVNITAMGDTIDAGIIVVPNQATPVTAEFSNWSINTVCQLSLSGSVACAVDNTSFSLDLEINNGTGGNTGKKGILYVVDNPSSLSASETTLLARLQVNYQVDTVSDGSVTAEMCEEYNCVLVSNSVVSTLVNDDVKEITVPLMVMEKDCSTALGFGTSFSTSSHTGATIPSGADSELIGSLSEGSITVYDSAQNMTNITGVPSSASIAVTRNGNPVIFEFESGEESAEGGFSFPGYRLAWFLDTGEVIGNANWLILFDAAIGELTNRGGLLATTRTFTISDDKGTTPVTGAKFGKYTFGSYSDGQTVQLTITDEDDGTCLRSISLSGQCTPIAATSCVTSGIPSIIIGQPCYHAFRQYGASRRDRAYKANPVIGSTSDADIYIVNNYDNSGEGSYNYGIDTHNNNRPRYIVFNRGGVWDTNSDPWLFRDIENLEVVGESAPSHVIFSKETHRFLQSRNIVVSHVVSSPSRDTRDGDKDCFEVNRGNGKIAFVNCDAILTVDEAANQLEFEPAGFFSNRQHTGLSPYPSEVIWFRCFIAYANKDTAVHSEGTHNYGSLVGGYNVGGFVDTWFHSLGDRNPKTQAWICYLLNCLHSDNEKKNIDIGAPDFNDNYPAQSGEQEHDSHVFVFNGYFQNLGPNSALNGGGNRNIYHRQDLRENRDYLYIPAQLSKLFSTDINSPSTTSDYITSNNDQVPGSTILKTNLANMPQGLGMDFTTHPAFNILDASAIPAHVKAVAGVRPNNPMGYVTAARTEFDNQTGRIPTKASTFLNPYLPDNSEIVPYDILSALPSDPYRIEGNGYTAFENWRSRRSQDVGGV